MYFFHALKNEECTFHEFFFGDTPAPFLGSLFWPVGLPFAVSIHGFALLASGAAKMIRRRAKLCEHEDKLRSLELIQAEKEVEKLLNG